MQYKGVSNLSKEDLASRGLSTADVFFAKVSNVLYVLYLYLCLSLLFVREFLFCCEIVHSICSR